MKLLPLLLFLPFISLGQDNSLDSLLNLQDHKQYFKVDTSLLKQPQKLQLQHLIDDGILLPVQPGSVDQAILLEVQPGTIDDKIWKERNSVLLDPSAFNNLEDSLLFTPKKDSLLELNDLYNPNESTEPTTPSK